MLHLFKKVYIESDAVINTHVDRFVISQEYGNIMLPILDTLSSGELLGCGHSLEDVVGEGKQYNTFLEFLVDLKSRNDQYNTPIYIYVDKKNFLEIATLWYKGLFSSITKDALFTLLSCQLQKEKNLGIFFKNNRITPNDYQKFITNYTISKQEIFDAFGAVTADFSAYGSFIDSIKDDLSTELLLSAYLFNGTGKESFRNKAHMLLRRDTINFITERRDILLDNILKKKMWDLFNLDPITIDNYDSIFTNSKLSSFFGADLYDGDDVIWTKLRDTNRLDIFISDFNILVSGLENHGTSVSDMPSMKRLALIPFITGDTISDEGIDAFIQFELDNPGASIITGCNRYKFNTYFLDFVLEPIRAGQTDRNYLAPYQLRTI